MKRYLILLSLVSLSLNAYAETCISGYDMEGQPSGTRVRPEESYYYDWDETATKLTGKPDTNYAMYLYVMPLGEYAAAVDWKYCPQSNTIQYNNTPMFTRTNRRIPHTSLIWVHYAKTN